MTRPIRPPEIITLTPKQSNIYSWGWQPRARHRIANCGRRFGKTFLLMREVKRAAQLAAKWNVHTDNEIWYGAPNFKQAKRVFWQRCKRSIPRSWIAGKPNESECNIRLVTGHIIRLVGTDQYDSLRGSGLFFYMGDEDADSAPEAWTEVIQPMLSTCNGNSIRIGTPKGFNHFYDNFQRGLPGAVDANGDPVTDYMSWTYTTIQGGNVPPEEIAARRAELDARTFRQEYEASFETYAGRVVYAFSRPVHVKSCLYDSALPIHIGMDFNVNPMSATLWQEKDGVSYQFDEIIIPTSDTVEMCREIAARYGRVSGRNSHVTIYPDPAGAQRRTSAQGQTDIGLLRSPEWGYKVVAMSSHPQVRDRTNTTNARFMAADGKISAYVDPKCRKSIEAYERLIYKEGTSDIEKGIYDHPVDATGYYMFTRFGGTSAKPVKIRGF